LDTALKARDGACRDRTAEALSRLYVRGGDYRAAIGILRRLMKANKGARKDPELNNLLGIAYYYEEMYEEASRKFKVALEEEPDYKEPLFNLKSMNMRLTHLNAARAYQRAKDYERALREFRALLHISQNFVTGHYRLGLLYLEMGRSGDAIKELTRAIRINPRHRHVHRCYKAIGDVYAAEERRIEAVEAYMKALERKPDYKEARVALEKYKAH
jgi:tetratricopeptide (TPR) repeat protein